MGLGENIGYGLLQTQNNPGNLYFASPTAITGRWVHNALMGDPTLRNDIVAPVSNVIATKIGYDCHISWSASTETILAGYNIYMKNDTTTGYVKLNATPLTGTSYTDNCLLYEGTYTYMVRALKLEQVPSGSYYNMSEGIADTAYSSLSSKVSVGFTSIMNGLQYNFTNNSVNSSTYSWNFGDGQTSTAMNPSVTYTANGTFVVTLIAGNVCDQDTSIETITVIEVGLNKPTAANALSVFPNPSSGKISISDPSGSGMNIQVFSTEGRKVAEFKDQAGGREIDLSALKSGVYFLRINSGGNLFNAKLVLE
jgi:type IX secretion system substrate protein/PKD domain-containing protein